MGFFSRNKKEDEAKDQIPSQDSASNHVESLMTAAKKGDVETIVAMFCARKDMTVTDNEGNNAVHYAAMNNHVTTFRYLVVITGPLDIWKVKNKQGQAPIDVAAGEDIHADLALLAAPPPSRTEDIHSKCNDRLLKAFPGWNSTTKLLVSLDGGGCKALIIAQILQHLEALVPNGGFCDRIDWVGGTSSGGIVSLQLGIGTSPIDCSRFLTEKRNCIFNGKSATKIPKHDGMENVSREYFGKARMHQITKMKVMITVADSRKSPPTLLLFRSYSPSISEEDKKKYQYLDPERIPVWKTARCTTAAPYYFDSFNGFSDGGLVANNPTQLLISDFYQLQKLEALHTDEKTDSPSPSDKIGAIISLGTGNLAQEKIDGIDVNFPKVCNPIQFAVNFFGAMNSAKKALQLLFRESTSSGGQPARYSRDWSHSLKIPFFRFSPYLTEEIALDTTDTENITQMLWETELYIRGEARFELLQLAKLLETKEIERKEEHKPFDCNGEDLRSEHEELRTPSDKKKS